MKNKWFKLLLAPELRPVLIWVLAGLIMSMLIGHQFPKAMAELLASYHDQNAFKSAMLGLGLLIGAEYLVRVLYQFSINLSVGRLLFRMRGNLYQKWICAAESDAHDNFPMGEVMARLMSDTEAIKELVTSGSFTILLDIVFILSGMISFLTLNSNTGIVMMVVQFLLVLLLFQLSKYMAKIFLEARQSMGKLSRVLADLTQGIEQSYFAPANPYIQNRSNKSFDEFLNLQLKANVWDASYYSFADSLYPIFLAFLIIVLPFTKLTEFVVIGALIDLIQRSINPIKELTSKISNWQRAKTGLDRISEFEAVLSKQRMGAVDTQRAAFQLKEMRVQIPNYSYPQNAQAFALKNIDFTAHAGEMIGIVGPSGCGKSTLLKILCAGLTPSKFSISLKGQTENIEYNEQDSSIFDSYLQQISIITQESHVFSCSLKDNITMGRNVDEFDAFWLQVREDIHYLKRWDIKPDDVINPKTLSIGQKQLICSLRACFLSKPVALFDEVASGLDSDLEWALRQMILRIQKKSLTIVVAHRLETVIEADQILVMNQGEIVASGKHRQLLDNSEFYRQFIFLLENIESTAH